MNNETRIKWIVMIGAHGSYWQITDSIGSGAEPSEAGLALAVIWQGDYSETFWNNHYDLGLPGTPDDRRAPPPVNAPLLPPDF